MIEPVEARLGRSAHFLRVIKAMSETAIDDSRRRNPEERGTVHMHL